jgi:hypothetical protein
LEEPKASRSFTPLIRGNVTLRDHEDQPTPVEKSAKSSNMPHSKRADRFSMLMGISAVLIIVLIVAGLLVHNRKYHLASAGTLNTTAPVIGYYQGSMAFKRKFEEEKSGFSSPDFPVKGANGDLQISLRGQSSSMEEKIKVIREEKTKEEPLPPEPDRGLSPVPVLGVRPTDIRKFSEPPEFSKMLPKSLQNSN